MRNEQLTIINEGPLITLITLITVDMVWAGGLRQGVCDWLWSEQLTIINEGPLITLITLITIDMVWAGGLR